MNADFEKNKKEIEEGIAVLGIEFGSTRIKSVLINSQNEPIAQGSYDWENTLSNGIWTYPLDEVMRGLSGCYAELKAYVKEKYGVTVKNFRALGISGMMHGYLAFDKDNELLVPFRTWRNTITGKAAAKLSSVFCYPVPERWSISHLYQAVLNDEKHVPDIAFFTTLSGFIHWKLTGKKVLGIGDASGMFPIDIKTGTYNGQFIKQFDLLVKDKKYPWKLEQLLPEVLLAGNGAGTLTEEGATLLDKEGDLQSGIPMCPPEGDAGTGMVATNSVAKRTGNVSAGTSVFAMVVLEKELSKVYANEIDLVTTPDGALVAMAHANNCTGEYDQWLNLFAEVLKATGNQIEKSKLYDKLLSLALQGDKDCGGLIPYNYISGESITGMNEGRAVFMRTQKNNFTLANFMRAQLFTALGALRIGMDILFDKEDVKIDCLTGHGGFFKTENVGAAIMAAAMHTPVSTLETAGEGGPWGIALLASYAAKEAFNPGKPLGDFLNDEVFKENRRVTIQPEKSDVDGFNAFFKNYKKGLAVERAAIEAID
ncbi:ATPase [Treponema parvum]|uniref:ATPase n=1 Tax=Treponema parvum TaxID=138851 RepID=A0A975F5F8_9SPIR|nr:FGGY-family carbohydrate kinase [Treponema parvum]QTQ14801.1 ATPase [Treponema parvum]